MRRKTISNSTPKAQGRVRIIAGHWRSRVLVFPAIEGLRPSGDRVRETLFNWLAPYINNSRCLDLFAGSGALGFEAASRGAEEVLIMERNSQALAALSKNRQELHAENVEIIAGDCVSWLERDCKVAFDIIFLDPPFSANLHEQCLDLMLLHGHIGEQTLVYIERPKHAELALIERQFEIVKEKTSGAIHFGLYRRRTV